MRARFNYNSVYRDTLTDAILFGSLNGMIRFTSRETKRSSNPTIFLVQNPLTEDSAQGNQSFRIPKK